MNDWDIRVEAPADVLGALEAIAGGYGARRGPCPMGKSVRFRWAGSFRQGPTSFAHGARILRPLNDLVQNQAIYFG